ncbi:MAG: NUDIX domain-containing protein [Bacteroidota bacterium]
MTFTYDYPRPSVTVDCVIFGLDDFDLKMLLIKRKHPPFEHSWALPGGFVNEEEDLHTAALRELEEETGVKDLFIEQLFTFGTPGRDPRGHVITVAYYALVNLTEHPVKPSTDASEAVWFELNNLPELAFDHKEIVSVAIARLKAKVRYQPIGFQLLPEQFTLFQLRRLYESILGGQINKRNFRTKILKMGILKAMGKQEDVPHRPAQLYSFDEARYQEMTEKGMNFEINTIVKKDGE